MSARINLVRPRRGLRPLALRWSVAGIAVCVACSADAPDQTGSEPPHLGAELSEVVYQGKVTDEALLRLLDRAPQPQSEPQLSVCTPALGAALTRETPIEFTLAPSGCTLAPDAKLNDRGGSAPNAERHARQESTETPTEPIVSALLGALGVGIAHAHGDPFNGTAYYLRVLDAEGVATMQAFTDGTSYAPSEAQWTRMVQGSRPLQLEIVWAEFDNNEVAGNGPFQVPPVTLLIEE